MKLHGKDTEKQVFFYENEFYFMSNFSSFAIWWKGKLYPTSEHAYHSEKFGSSRIKEQIRGCYSAHDALKLAHSLKDKYIPYWDEIKVSVMRRILRAKARQHEYIGRKLLETGDRELVEDSWRDDFWGWGPNKDGKNWMGKLWMEIREELRESENWIKPIDGKTGCEPGDGCDTTKGPCSCGAWH